MGGLFIHRYLVPNTGRADIISSFRTWITGAREVYHDTGIRTAGDIWVWRTGPTRQEAGRWIILLGGITALFDYGALGIDRNCGRLHYTAQHSTSLDTIA